MTRLTTCPIAAPAVTLLLLAVHTIPASADPFAYIGVPLPDDPNQGIPTYLQCPAPPDNGQLTSITERRNGKATKIVTYFRSGISWKIEIITADKNASFDPSSMKSIDLTAETNLDQRYFATIFAGIEKELNVYVCNADADTKRRYFDGLGPNKDALRKAAPDNFRSGIPGR
jgi:hypothetical protein